MSSTSTTWTTDTNTKSGVVQIYESNVSVLKILGIEDGNSILELFADQGDNNADKWRMWVNASDDDLHFANYTSGSWADLLTIQDGGNVGIGTDAPASKLHVAGTVQVGVDGSGQDVIFYSGTSGDNLTWDASAEVLQITGTDGQTALDVLDGDLRVVDKIYLYDRGGEYISSDGTDLTIAAGTAVNITADVIDLSDATKDITLNAAVDALNFNSNTLSIDASNNRVGIGTDAPVVPLHVRTGGDSPAKFESTDPGSYIHIYDGADNCYVGVHDGVGDNIAFIGGTAAGSANNLNIVTSGGTAGNVGIGTTSPAVDLDIEDATTSSATQGGNLRLGSNDGAVMASGHRLGVLEFAGAEDTSSTMTVGARIEAVASETWSASDNGASLDFYTTAGNDNAAQRMTILAGGNVGIGANSPDGKLELEHYGNSTAQYITTYSDTDTHTSNLVFRKSHHDTPGEIAATVAGEDLGAISWYGVNTSPAFGVAAQILVEGDASPDPDSVSGRMKFLTSQADGSLPTRMTIDDGGNVGIGTDTPTSPLHTTTSTAGVWAGHFTNTDTGGAAYGLKVELTDDDAADLAFGVITNSAWKLMVLGDGNVGIGVSDPDTTLEVYKVGTQLKLSGGAADYATFAVAADGHLTIATVDATDGTEGDIALMPQGNVGIGTTTPGAALHIYKDLSVADDLGDWDNYHLILEGGASTDDTVAMLFASTATTGDTYGGSAIVHYDTGVGGKGDLAFFTKQATTAIPPVEVMRLSSDGKITSTSATGTAAGAGIDAVSPTISVGNYNSEIVTTIFIDIGAGGISSSSGAGDVIGEDGVSGAHITRITTAINGLVYRGEIICLEVPTTGDPDVNVAAHVSSAFAEDAGGEGEHVLANCGVHTLGLKTDFTIPAGGIVNDYIYLTHGGTTAGTYNAGKFLLRFYGASVSSL